MAPQTAAAAAVPSAGMPSASSSPGRGPGPGGGYATTRSLPAGAGGTGSSTSASSTSASSSSLSSSAATGAPRRPPSRSQPFRAAGYELRETLGEGEFGKVKLAVHAATRTQVAIKVFKRTRLDDDEKRLKLQREIDILRGVVHHAIVRLYEVVETDDLIGLVIQYASGGELFDYILAQRCLPEDEAARLFAQLADGVSYLHSKNVVHRDLKLENLLLSSSKDLVIIDFGFANQFSVASPGTRSKSTATASRPYRHIPDWHCLLATSCGSPCYAAPELVIADGYVGTLADVWSCGVILYAMLAGYLPFDDDPQNPHGDNITLLYKYILQDPTPLHFPTHISDTARDLIRRMLVPDPERRITLNEVMRHKWLAKYAHIFGKERKPKAAAKAASASASSAAAGSAPTAVAAAAASAPVESPTKASSKKKASKKPPTPPRDTPSPPRPLPPSTTAMAPVSSDSWVSASSSEVIQATAPAAEGEAVRAESPVTAGAATAVAVASDAAPPAATVVVAEAPAAMRTPSPEPAALALKGNVQLPATPPSTSSTSSDAHKASATNAAVAVSSTAAPPSALMAAGAGETASRDSAGSRRGSADASKAVAAAAVAAPAVAAAAAIAAAAAPVANAVSSPSRPAHIRIEEPPRHAGSPKHAARPRPPPPAIPSLSAASSTAPTLSATYAAPAPAEPSAPPAPPAVAIPRHDAVAAAAAADVGFAPNLSPVSNITLSDPRLHPPSAYATARTSVADSDPLAATGGGPPLASPTATKRYTLPRPKKMDFMGAIKDTLARQKWLRKRGSGSSKDGSRKRTSGADGSFNASNAASPEAAHASLRGSMSSPGSVAAPDRPLSMPEESLVGGRGTAAAAAAAAGASAGAVAAGKSPIKRRSGADTASGLFTSLPRPWHHHDEVFAKTEIRPEALDEAFNPSYAESSAGSAVGGSGTVPRSGAGAYYHGVHHQHHPGLMETLKRRSASIYEEPVFSKTELPHIPPLPDVAPPTRAYQSVYPDMQAADQYAQQIALGRTVSQKSLTQKLKASLARALGRDADDTAAVPPPLPYAYFADVMPRPVEPHVANTLPPEAFTARTPELALLEARRVLEGLGAIVIGHTSDPVTHAPGHGEGRFKLKCRLRLGKKGLTHSRMRAELDAMTLMASDPLHGLVPAGSGVGVASTLDGDVGDVMVDVQDEGDVRGLRRSASRASTAWSDALSVYSVYSTHAGGAVLPEDYPPLYTQPDVTAAIAAGRTSTASGATGLARSNTKKSLSGLVDAVRSSKSSSGGRHRRATSMSSLASLGRGGAVTADPHAPPVPPLPELYGRESIVATTDRQQAPSELPSPPASGGLRVAAGLRKFRDMGFRSDLLFTLEVCSLPNLRTVHAFIMHRTKGSSVRYGMVKQIVLLKVFHTDAKVQQLLA